MSENALKMGRLVGRGARETVAQALAQRESPYGWPPRSPLRCVGIAKAAHTCGELGNRADGLRGAPLGRVLEGVGSGRARFCAARNFAETAAVDRDTSGLSC